MKNQRKSRGLGMTFIIVCLVLSGCGAGTQEAALGSAEECVQAAKIALEGEKCVTYKGKEIKMSKYHFFSQRLSHAKLRIGGHDFK